MSGPINRVVILIVNALNDIRLFAQTGVRKGGISSSEIFQVRFKRADVDGGAAWNFVAQIQGRCDFLHLIDSGELSNTHTHCVAGMN